jgi:hypothetical protein
VQQHSRNLFKDIYRIIEYCYKEIIVYHVNYYYLSKKPLHFRTQSPCFESVFFYFESGFSKVKSGFFLTRVRIFFESGSGVFSSPDFLRVRVRVRVSKYASFQRSGNRIISLFININNLLITNRLSTWWDRSNFKPSSTNTFLLWLIRIKGFDIDDICSDQYFSTMENADMKNADMENADMALSI